MKIFKLKLQEYKRKINDAKIEVKKRYMVSKMKAKAIFAMWIRKIERRFGLEQRCSLCGEKLFCEEYSCRKSRKGLFNAERCNLRHSDK